MSLSISGRALGDGLPVYVVFEAGPTHDGLEAACALVDVAAEAGADAVKFQMVDADHLVPDKGLMFQYGWLKDRETGEVETVSESLWEILKRRELTPDEWKTVVAHCREKGISFFSTATTLEELEFLADLGCDMVKICSGDITYFSFLREAARYDWAVQIDTGGSTLWEVERAVEVLEEAGCEKIIINHCPSGYPARLQSINLRVLTTLRSMYPAYPVAFSDHTPGRDMDVAAVALGAHILEKTITLDRTTRSPEHVMSLEPGEAGEFVQAVRDVETALGTPRRLMADMERSTRLASRRSLYAARDLAEGSELGADDLAFRRPGDGIPADMEGLVVGRTLRRDVAEGDKLAFSDFR